jgi:periplasmic copper chaperone A
MRKTLAALTFIGLLGGTVGAAAQHHHQSAGPAAATERKAVKTEAKGLSVVSAWSRATPGGAKTGAVFLEINAAPEAGDRLLAASGTVADAIEIHTHTNDGGVMKMRKVEGIDVPEGGAAKLVPGGDHIMLIGLKQPLKAGEAFKLKLTFEKAGAIDVDVTVRSNTAAPAGKAAGGHTH